MADTGFAAVPEASRYRLINATLPAALVDATGLPAHGDGLVTRVEGSGSRQTTTVEWREDGEETYLPQELL